MKRKRGEADNGSVRESIATTTTIIIINITTSTLTSHNRNNTPRSPRKLPNEVSFRSAAPVPRPPEVVSGSLSAAVRRTRRPA